jgi:hypothetical protein
MQTIIIVVIKLLQRFWLIMQTHQQTLMNITVRVINSLIMQVPMIALLVLYNAKLSVLLVFAILVGQVGIYQVMTV